MFTEEGSDPFDGNIDKYNIISKNVTL